MSNVLTGKINQISFSDVVPVECQNFLAKSVKNMDSSPTRIADSEEIVHLYHQILNCWLGVC